MTSNFCARRVNLSSLGLTPSRGMGALSGLLLSTATWGCEPPKAEAETKVLAPLAERPADAASPSAPPAGEAPAQQPENPAKAPEQPKAVPSTDPAPRALNDNEQDVTRLQLHPGLTPIFEHSFRLNLDEIDEAAFIVATSSEGKALEFLITSQGKLHQNLELPEETSAWTQDSVAAVSFKDLNGDGLTDILVIAEYMTGIGPEGAKPFPTAFVYLCKGNVFQLSAELSEKAQKGGKNMQKAIALAQKT